MELIRKVGKFFRDDSANHIDEQNAVIVTEEKASNKLVQFAKDGISNFFALIEEGHYDDAVTALKIFHESAKEKFSGADIKFIKDQLFEAGLEIALSMDKEFASQVLLLADSPTTPNDGRVIGLVYHFEAATCWEFLSRQWVSPSLVSVLEGAIHKRTHLRCAAYFLSTVFEDGKYGVQKDAGKAQKYFQIATERGYEPGQLVPMRKVNEKVHTLNRILQQRFINPESPLNTIPNELNSYISLLHRKAVLAEVNSKPTQNKK